MILTAVHITIIFKTGFMPILFELSCMGGRPLIKLLYYRQLTTAVKRCFAFYERFSSFDVKRFPQPLYRCVLLRLVEDQREESLNEAENVTIVTTYKVSKRLIGSNKEFLTKHRYTSVIVQCIRSDNSEQRTSMWIILPKLKSSCTFH